MRLTVIITLLAGLAGAQTQVDWIHQIKNQPFADIRSYGAICNGTDQNTAIQAAIAAGAVNLLIPKGCTWIAPGGVIPGGLKFIGESSANSIIRSNVNPSTAILYYGAGTTLEHLNLQGQGTTQPSTNCPAEYVSNQSDQTQPWISTCFSMLDSINGQSGKDTTSVFFKTEAPISGSVADGMNASNCFPTPGCLGTGNAIRADNYSGNAGAAAVLATAMPGTADGVEIVKIANFTGSQGSGGIKSPILLEITDSYRVAGPMVYLSHTGSTYAQTMMDIEAAQGSGTFTGNFINFGNNNQTQMKVTSEGNLYLVGGSVAGGGSTIFLSPSVGTGGHNWGISSTVSGATFGAGQLTIYDNTAGNVGLNLSSTLATFPKALRLTPGQFSLLSACGAGTEGQSAAVIDSTTNTWGAVVTGSGSNHVKAYCDGTNWTVEAK